MLESVHLRFKFSIHLPVISFPGNTEYNLAEKIAEKGMKNSNVSGRFLAQLARINLGQCSN